jgi:hypothetical protein
VVKQASVKIERLDDFLGRARKVTRLADAAKPIPERFVISFEDPADMLAVLTPARLALFRVIKKKPGSIANQRYRSQIVFQQPDLRGDQYRNQSGQARRAIGKRPQLRSTIACKANPHAAFRHLYSRNRRLKILREFRLRYPRTCFPPAQ